MSDSASNERPRRDWPLRLPDAPLWYIDGSYAATGEPQYGPDEENEARYQAARRWVQLPLPMEEDDAS